MCIPLVHTKEGRGGEGREARVDFNDCASPPPGGMRRVANREREISGLTRSEFGRLVVGPTEGERRNDADK